MNDDDYIDSIRSHLVRATNERDKLKDVLREALGWGARCSFCESCQGCEREPGDGHRGDCKVNETVKKAAKLGVTLESED